MAGTTSPANVSPEPAPRNINSDLDIDVSVTGPAYLMLIRNLPHRPDLLRPLINTPANDDGSPSDEQQEIAFHLLVEYAKKYDKAVRRARAKVQREAILTDDGKALLCAEVSKVEVVWRYQKLPRRNGPRNVRNNMLGDLLVEALDAQQ